MKEIGFIFDMDGVIVNNHHYHYLAWQRIAEKYGVMIDETFYREKMNGRTLMELMDIVFERKMSKEEAREIGLEKEAVYRELYKEHRRPTAGLIDFMETARSKNIPMVVGTSAPPVNVTYTLEDLDLLHYFVGVVDDSMVKQGKPDPEVYLRCAEMIGRAPKNCIVFEDAVSGIRAGESAGAQVVALATSHAREELPAQWIIDDFTQLTWDMIGKVLHLDTP